MSRRALLLLLAGGLCGLAAFTRAADPPPVELPTVASVLGEKAPVDDWTKAFGGGCGAGRSCSEFDLRRQHGVLWRFEMPENDGPEDTYLNMEWGCTIIGNRVYLSTFDATELSLVLDLESGDMVGKVFNPARHAEDMLGQEGVYTFPMGGRRDGDDVILSYEGYAPDPTLGLWEYSVKKAKTSRFWSTSYPKVAGPGQYNFSIIHWSDTGILKNYAFKATYTCDQAGSFNVGMNNWIPDDEGIDLSLGGNYPLGCTNDLPRYYNRRTEQYGATNPNDDRDYSDLYYDYFSIKVKDQNYEVYNNSSYGNSKLPDGTQLPGAFVGFAVDSKGNTLVVLQKVYEGFLKAYDLDGSLRWAHSIPFIPWPESSNPHFHHSVSFGNQVAFVEINGDLVQLSADDGKETYRLKGAIPNAEGDLEGYYDDKGMKLSQGKLLVLHTVPSSVPGELIDTIECIGKSDIGLPVNGRQKMGRGMVNTYSGNKMMVVRDLHLPGKGLSLDVTRVYNSNANPAGPYPGGQSFGPGWSFGLLRSLRLSGLRQVTMLRGDGRSLSWKANEDLDESGERELRAPLGVFDRLKRLEDGTYEMKENNGTIYRFRALADPDDKDPPADAGYLYEIEDPFNNKLSFKFSVGDLESITDSSGRVTRFETWDRRIHSMTDPAGRRTDYIYQNSPSLGEVKGPGDYHAEYKYEGPGGRMSSARDTRQPAGQRAQGFRYDEQSHRMTEVYDLDSPNLRTRYEFSDAPGAPSDFPFDKDAFFGVRITDALDRHRFEQYDGEFLLASYDAAGNKTVFEWDNAGNQKSITDALQRTTLFEHDLRGNLTDKTDALGQVTHYEYEGDFNQLVLSRDPNGHETHYEYFPGKPSLKKVTNAKTETVTYTYFSNGLRETMTSGREKVTHYEYDDYGNLKKVIDPLTHSVESTYDNLSRKLTDKDALDAVTSYEYDGQDRLTVTRRPLPNNKTAVTTLTYDGQGNLSSSTDPNGHNIQFVYNSQRPGLDLLEKVIQLPGARTTVTEYDELGRRIALVDQNGNRTTYTYDVAGDLKTVIDAMGGKIEFSYDAVGRKTQVQAPNNNNTSYNYDAIDRVVSVRDAFGSVSHQYDAAGNRVWTQDPRGMITTATYDALNRPTRVQHSWRGTGMDLVWKEYDYDADGNIIERRDNLDPDGVTFHFDDAGRLDWQDISLLTKRNSSWKKSFIYDNNNRRKELKVEGGDFDSNTSGEQPYVVRYDYDEQGRLTKLKDRLDMVIANYTYDAAGRLSYRRLENQVESGYIYDDGDRVLSIDHRLDLTGIVNDPQYRPSLLGSVSYSYDAVGNPLQVNRDGREADYSYDALNRLVRETQDQTGLAEADASLCPACPTPDPKASLINYFYDAAGNRTKQLRIQDGKTTVLNYTYASGTNELQGISDNLGSHWNYQYDAMGNLTWRNQQTLTYDYAGRLASAQAKDLSHSLYYDYDGEGERVQTRKGYTGLMTGDTTYIYDGLQVIADIEAISGEVKASYIVGRGQTLKKITPSPASDGRAIRDYFLHDALGSVVMTVDDRGQIKERRSYEPFGQDKGASSEHRQSYTGQDLEAETGLHYYHARWMDAEVGRFGQVDPYVGNEMVSTSWNGYLYVNNNPLTGTDPNGMIGRWLSDWVDGIKGHMPGGDNSSPQDEEAVNNAPVNTSGATGTEVSELEKVLIVEATLHDSSDIEGTKSEMRAIAAVIKKRADKDGISIQEALRIHRFIQGYPFEAGSDENTRLQGILEIANSPERRYKTYPSYRMIRVNHVAAAREVAKEVGDGTILQKDPLPNSTNFRTTGDPGEFADTTKWEEVGTVGGQTFYKPR